MLSFLVMSHHSIGHTKNHMLHANFVALRFTQPELLPIEVLHCANRDLRPFCSSDLDLDQLTFIDKPDPYSIEIYRMCKYELTTSRLSKVMVWETHRHDWNYIPRCFAGGQLRMSTTNATVCAQQEACWVCSPEPLKSVNLLFNLKALQVVELRLMRLERAVHFVLGTMRRRLALLNDQIRLLFTKRLTQIMHSPPWH